MPALGIAMLISFMGKKSIMPFFFLGFFLTVYLKLDIMAITVFAAVLAIVFYNTNFLSANKKDNLT